MTDSHELIVENTTFDEIVEGQSFSLSRTLSQDDIQAFAAVSLDTNPAHLDPEYASHTPLHEVVGHGMWTASLLSTILGTRFPGPGTIYLGQSLRFMRPVHLNDTVTATVRVSSKREDKKIVVLACQVVNQKGAVVLEGEATVLAPLEKMKKPIIHAPRFQIFEAEARLKVLLDRAAGQEPVRCGVVHPCDEGSLRGAIEAAEMGFIVPTLIGPEGKMRALAEQVGLDLSPFVIVDTAHSHESAERAAQMAAAGEFEGLMKGSLHTDELMHEVVSTKALRTGRRLSHVFRFDVPLYNKPILITDAALNIRPTLLEKRDIVQNAIDLALMLGRECPKVAILSAVETLTPDIPSTIDAAALCKMADRGQIRGGVLDGPLAFDNAVSLEAVHIKGISSPVAGDAEILVVPDLESGNMLSKQLEYLAGALGCGVVLGARVPIALTSRADGPASRRASALLVKLIAHHYRSNRP